MPSRALLDSLTWLQTVNAILEQHQYHSADFGRLSNADFIRIDDALAAGETPESFAKGILDRDTVTT